MKTASMPSVRVDPALREEVESLLGEGETLSEFVEASVRANVARRRNQARFVVRGLRSLAYRPLTRTLSPAAEGFAEHLANRLPQWSEGGVTAGLSMARGVFRRKGFTSGQNSFQASRGDSLAWVFIEGSAVSRGVSSSGRKLGIIEDAGGVALLARWRFSCEHFRRPPWPA